MELAVYDDEYPVESEGNPFLNKFGYVGRLQTFEPDAQPRSHQDERQNEVNDFGGQEPGTNAEIASFCRSTYGVRFPMFSKIRVTGTSV